MLVLPGCGGKGNIKNTSQPEADTVSVPDTGYTGIMKYYSGQYVVKEVTFRNGIRQGEMKSFYQGGQLYQSFWYENGLREDSARWYYLEGQVFRATPYKHDTIDGIQVQYYRTGRVKAKIGYTKGLRTPYIEEFTPEGGKVTGYPEIVYNISDNYKSAGKVKIDLGLSNKSDRVKFYRGEFENGVFDTTKCISLRSSGGKASIELKKTGTPQQPGIGVIAEIRTSFGNKFLEYKKIELPYPDLK